MAVTPIKETNKETWTPQIWQGNPELNLVCSCKFFGKIPVWIFGGTKEYQGFSFCVNAGANSSKSYSGSIPEEIHELHKAEIFVDEKHINNTLIK